MGVVRYLCYIQYITANFKTSALGLIPLVLEKRFENGASNIIFSAGSIRCGPGKRELWHFHHKRDCAVFMSGFKETITF
jgi:hypothetical protein